MDGLSLGIFCELTSRSVIVAKNPTCKNTFPRSVAALVLVSSMAFLSPGLALTERRLVSMGKRTCQKCVNFESGG